MKRKATQGITKRWQQQAWVLDLAIGVFGPLPFTGNSIEGSYNAIGTDIHNETETIRQNVKKISDIKRICTKLAMRRLNAAKEAQRRKSSVSARENYFAASLMFGSARWPIWEDDNAELTELNESMVESYRKYIAYADREIERIKIPFLGGNLNGILHFPKRKTDKMTCILSIPGMDTFKEQMVRMYGDKYLERGHAVLALDGPGQGETRIRGIKVTVDNYEKAGKAAMDYLRGLKAIDKDRISMRGQSLGSYWCPKVLAYDDRFKAGAVTAVCHEPGLGTLFNSAHPSFKLRHMWMTGIFDETEFDHRYASKLTLEGVGAKVRCPMIITAGEDDPLSPIKWTYRFFEQIKGPKKLIVYRGEGHHPNDPQMEHLMADFVSDALLGRIKESKSLLVDDDGTIKENRIRNK
ncbi:MAG: alpha/beta hydrolase family protein [Candidatus Bathyarchaeia archaeon]